MNLETTLILSTCLLALVISLVAAQSTTVVGSESSADRVKRRSYYNPWSVSTGINSVSLYEASNRYKPAEYTIPRPYYIPVYGNAGRPLLFYPPQQFYVNPGTPQDNPPVAGYGGPSYLPPKQSPHFLNGGAKNTTTRVDFEDDNDDGPVWGASNGGMVQMPLSGGQDKELEPRPTRAPMARPAQPPLVHASQAAGQSIASPPAQQSRPIRPTQPPPTTQRPTVRATTSPPSGPSNCVWAIISCCSATNPKTPPQNCFEQRGCPGPFWGPSPCESDYARAAIASAVNYYNTNPRSSFGK